MGRPQDVSDASDIVSRLRRSVLRLLPGTLAPQRAKGGTINQSGWTYGVRRTAYGVAWHCGCTLSARLSVSEGFAIWRWHVAFVPRFVNQFLLEGPTDRATKVPRLGAVLGVRVCVCRPGCDPMPCNMATCVSGRTGFWGTDRSKHTRQARNLPIRRSDRCGKCTVAVPVPTVCR